MCAEANRDMLGDGYKLLTRSRIARTSRFFVLIYADSCSSYHQDRIFIEISQADASNEPSYNSTEYESKRS